jgi:RimJ/RimL family protein N-acetyltransferase
MTEPHLIALPFTVSESNADKLEYILDKCCEHRPWFDDRIWEDYRTRREAANKYLAHTLINGYVWEVWRARNLLGILLLTDIQECTSAVAHFIFFDRDLRSKVQLCQSVMEWAFRELDLHILRLEIPTYAKILAHFARKRLGFRYEAEGRIPSWPKLNEPLSAKAAELGSRKHQAILYDGKWCDVLLLSLTRKEFESGSIGKEAGRTNSTNAGAVRPDGAIPREHT